MNFLVLLLNILDTNTERESGRKAQLSNIEATKVKKKNRQRIHFY